MVLRWLTKNLALVINTEKTTKNNQKFICGYPLIYIHPRKRFVDALSTWYSPLTAWYYVHTARGRLLKVSSTRKVSGERRGSIRRRLSRCVSMFLCT